MENTRSTATKAGIYFTGSGAILLLTSYDSLSHAHLIDKLAAKGIKKSIAHEVSEESVKEKYSSLKTRTIVRGTGDDVLLWKADSYH